MPRPLRYSLLLLLLAVPVRADDLDTIDRTIRKEPVYKTKPQYGLLIFGLHARTKVWVVRDGDRLFVDRNGNGDLTEPGEVVTYKNEEGWSDPKDDVYCFVIGDIRDGPLVHKQVSIGFHKIDHMAEEDEAIKKLLAKEPNFRAVSVRAEVETPGRRGVGVGGRLTYRSWHADHRGFLRFSNTPREAPVFDFGGPWVITQFDRNVLRPGRATDFVLGFGTLGRGAGASLYVGYEGLVPPNVYPKLTITYPAQADEAPITEHHELKERC